jgi:hypothetical protein
LPQELSAMSDLTLILAYLGLAAALAFAARYSRGLRRMIGWHAFGSQPRSNTDEGALAARLASVGTGLEAVTEGDWRVFRPSIGTRLLTPGLSVALLLTMFDPSTLGYAEIDVPPMMAAGILLLLVYANVMMLRYRVEVSGDTLGLRTTLLPVRLFDLRLLDDVEEDAVHSFRLDFADGRSVEILKTVAGADELRQILRVRLKRNQRG